MQKMLIFMPFYNCLYKHQCQWYSDGDKVRLVTFLYQLCIEYDHSNHLIPFSAFGCRDIANFIV